MALLAVAGRPSPLDADLQSRGGEEEERKVWWPPLQGIADQAHLAGAGGAAPKPQAEGEVAQGSLRWHSPAAGHGPGGSAGQRKGGTLGGKAEKKSPSSTRTKPLVPPTLACLQRQEQKPGCPVYLPRDAHPHFRYPQGAEMSKRDVLGVSSKELPGNKGAFSPKKMYLGLETGQSVSPV